VVKLYVMAKKHITPRGKNNTAKQGKAYAAGMDTDNNKVHEPSPAAYGYVHNPIAGRSVMLMGMEGKKGFAGISNDNDLISLIRAGIPKQAMTHLMDVADITLTEMASIIHTTDRTLRRYTAQQKLSQEQSERMIEMARLYSRGEETFGTMDNFKVWMDTALAALGNKKPKTFLDTSLGINMLMNELGRIEHGILA